MGRRRSLGLQLEAAVGAEAVEQLGVSRGEPPAAKSAMRNQEAIERISGPLEIQRLLEPRDGRRIIQRPAIVLDEVAERSSPAKADATGFDEQLDLQQARGRKVHPPDQRLQPAPSPVAQMKPEHRVCVEEDHRGRRRAVNCNPPASQVQVHCPEAMAGSRWAMIDFGGTGRRDRARWD